MRRQRMPRLAGVDNRLRPVHAGKVENQPQPRAMRLRERRVLVVYPRVRLHDGVGAAAVFALYREQRADQRNGVARQVACQRAVRIVPLPPRTGR